VMVQRLLGSAFWAGESFPPNEKKGGGGELRGTRAQWAMVDPLRGAEPGDGGPAWAASLCFSEKGGVGGVGGGTGKAHVARSSKGGHWGWETPRVTGFYWDSIVSGQKGHIGARPKRGRRPCPGGTFLFNCFGPLFYRESKGKGGGGGRPIVGAGTTKKTFSWGIKRVPRRFLIGKKHGCFENKKKTGGGAKGRISKGGILFFGKKAGKSFFSVRGKKPGLPRFFQGGGGEKFFPQKGGLEGK